MVQRLDFSKNSGFLARIAPFIVLGIFCILGIIGFIVLSYVALIGVAIGLVLFITSYVYKLLKRRGTMPPQAKQRPGKTYDHKDL